MKNMTQFFPMVLVILLQCLRLLGTRALLSESAEKISQGKLREALVSTQTHVFILSLPGRRAHASIMIEALGISEDQHTVIESTQASFFSKDVVAALVENGTITPAAQSRSESSGAKWYEKITPGRLGCWRSHMKAHRAFIRSDYNQAIFLEDDIDLGQLQDPTSGLLVRERLATVLMRPPPSADAIYLGYCHEACRPQAKFVTLVGSNRASAPVVLREAVRPLCTHAYLLLSKSAALFVASRLDPIYGMPVDHALAQLLARPGHRLQSKTTSGGNDTQEGGAAKERRGGPVSALGGFVAIPPLLRQMGHSPGGSTSGHGWELALRGVHIASTTRGPDDPVTTSQNPFCLWRRCRCADGSSGRPS